MPAGVSFPEEWKHLMFLELGLESLGERFLAAMGLRACKDMGQPGHGITRKSIIPLPLCGLSAEISKAYGQHQNCGPR